MNLTLMSFTCVCQHKFCAPDLPWLLYGEFLVRSANNEIRYLNALNDHAFEEVSQLVKAALGEMNMEPQNSASALHAIFGSVACDVDSRGKAFNMNVFPPCPNCGRNEIASWDAAVPPTSVNVDVPDVTHYRWDRMSDEKKYATVRTTLRSWLANGRRAR